MIIAQTHTLTINLIYTRNTRLQIIIIMIMIIYQFYYNKIL